MPALTLALMGLNAIVSVNTYEYDELGRVIVERGNGVQNVRYAYDAEGRVTQVTDSQNRVTRMNYDPRGRLIQSIDAAGGTTQIAYDLADRPIQVSDPRKLVTTYEFDGFGQMWKQVSPDTGTTQHQYDAAGLRTATTRADGSVVSFGYDGLGRMTSASAEDQTLGYSYDWCGNGKGQLCGTSGPGTATHFGYTSNGELQIRRDFTDLSGQKTDYSTTYGYDGINRLSQITYPNGDKATYTYGSQGKPSALVATVDGTQRSIISQANWKATGAHESLVYGNGLVRGYNHDPEGRLTAMSVWGPNSQKVSYLDYQYSGDGEITAIIDAVDPNMTQLIGYDALSRLTRLTRFGVTNQLSYDAGGNHDRYQGGNQLTQYSIDPSSNRVLDYTNQDGSRQYQYDALGNRISETAGSRISTYEYDAFNRMSRSNIGGLVTDYMLNAQGQRVAKINLSTNSRYFYAGQNQLMTELNNGVWTNYFWFEGELVGLARSGQHNYVHTDHLGRPEFVSSPNQNTVWKAYNYAYGRSVQKDEIGGLNIGFPGQYYDAESGLWYNGFRDYDASIGRYVQSDPIGLAGGMNTYAYAEGNPITGFDPLGLCKTDYLGAILGAADMVAGASAITAGSVDAIIAAAAGSEDGGLIGLTVAALGLATLHDGGNNLMTAFDGKERTPALEKVGGTMLGWQGAQLGRYASNFNSVTSLSKGVRNVLRGSAKLSDAHEIAKGVKENSGGAASPCDCGGK